MLVPVPVIAFPIALLGALAVTGGASFWAYEHGQAVAEARQTKADFAQYRQDQEVLIPKLLEKAGKASQDFEAAKPKIITQVQWRTRDVQIPADADPFVPVWFVRMFDRLASEDPAADTYPGEPAGAPSRTRLSGTKPVLEAWVGKYETCRKQIDSIRELNPMLPQPIEEKSLFDRLNPF